MQSFLLVKSQLSLQKVWPHSFFQASHHFALKSTIFCFFPLPRNKGTFPFGFPFGWIHLPSSTTPTSPWLNRPRFSQKFLAWDFGWSFWFPTNHQPKSESRQAKKCLKGLRKIVDRGGHPRSCIQLRLNEMPADFPDSSVVELVQLMLATRRTVRHLGGVTFWKPPCHYMSKLQKHLAELVSWVLTHN